MTDATRRVGGRLITLAVILAVIIGVLVWYLGRGGGYTVKLVFPAATNLNTGGLVEDKGNVVGHVKHLSVNDGQAIVEVSVSGADAPLHAGTTAAIDYKSLLGERYVEINPGSAKNPVIPKGGVIGNGDGDGSTSPRVEIQDILNQLDPTTRSQLGSLIPQLQEIFAGSTTQDTQATLQSAQPTVTALAKVLEAVGNDGQTLHELVAQLADLSTRLVNKQSSLAGTVSGLDQSMDAVASETGNLQTGIQELPATLTQANTTLGLLPGATQAALPLLADLKTATTGLPQFSTDLKPVLDLLSPVSQQLVPTLNGLSTLLLHTPQLATTANAEVPKLTGVATQAVPSVATLRPFTPDIVGMLTDWGNWLSVFNGTGHLAPVEPSLGNTSLDLGSVGGLNLSALSAINLPGQSYQANRGPAALPQQASTAAATTQTDAAGNPIQ